jgi:predicted metal-dependent phosphoesterase TrpH
MSSYYDLHTHTTYSDGTLTPTELVRRAVDHGVRVLAVTDHDETAALTEAKDAAEASGLRLVPGVEVSVTWERQTLHILGLGIDPADPGLNRGLAESREFRRWRAREIDRRLARKGIAGSLVGAQALMRGNIVSRTHFARHLVQQGHVRNLQQAFKKFLGRGAPGHIPGQWMTLPRAVQWIRGAGGQAVMAHPARYKLGSQKLRRLFAEFKEAGGVGIEVVSGSQDADARFRFGELACRYDFLASVGSDYHGPEKPWVELGKLPALPERCIPIWRSWKLE